MGLCIQGAMAMYCSLCIQGKFFTGQNLLENIDIINSEKFRKLKVRSDELRDFFNLKKSILEKA